MTFPDEDRTLVAQVQQGCENSFKALTDKYYIAVYNRCYFFLGDAEESLDLTQEIFLEVFRGLKNFRGDSTFFTWLYQIATNKAKFRRRYLIRRRNINYCSSDTDENTELSEASEERSDPETLCSLSQLRETIHQCLKGMQPLRRKLIKLKYLDEHSIDEICAKLNLSRGSVRWHLSQSRYEIRELLRSALDPDDIPDSDECETEENDIQIPEEA
jgi:RNA polymerase sigma-70 factor (ECF subfamily)